MSKILVDEITTRDGTSTLTLGASGKTLSIPSGCTISNSGTASGFGKIGQIVQASTTSETQLQTTSFGDTNLTGSITPTSTSSKIIVDVRGFVMIDASVSSSGRNANHRLVRTLSSSDTTLQTDEHTLNMPASGSNNTGYFFQIGYQYLDTPNTTSACSYKIQISVDNTNYRINFPHDGNKATITLTELLA